MSKFIKLSSVLLVDVDRIIKIRPAENDEGMAASPSQSMVTIRTISPHIIGTSSNLYSGVILLTFLS